MEEKKSTKVTGPNKKAAEDIEKKGNEVIEQTKEENAQALNDLKEQNAASLEAFDAETTILQNEAAATNTAALNQQNDYMKILNGFEDIANTRVQQQENENKTSELEEYNARTWGGLTEVAANLVNLGGVMAGASNQQIKPHQQEWVNRADQLRRERDAKLENYRRQLQSLQEQKEKVKHNFDTENTKRQLSTNSILSRRLQQKANLQRDYTKAETTLANNNAKMEAQMANNLLKLINGAGKVTTTNEKNVTALDDLLK